MKAASNSNSSSAGEITLLPIGVVESPFVTVSDRCDYATEARVCVAPEFAAGLTGIEYFSHLWVIYHQHCADAWLRARCWSEVRPLVIPGDDERAGQGIFSSRAPCRPAALGSCIVELVRREGAALVVRGLDAIDGTPVLDVKPYVPAFDAFPAAVVPLHWAKVMARADDPAHGSRAFHWDTTNADFALGQRAGLAALGQFGGRRGDVLRAEVHGSLFVAQGFEMATGCSPLRGTLVFAEAERGEPRWIRVSDRTGRMCRFVLTAGPWPDAVAVFAAKDAELWTTSSGVAGAT